MEDTFLATSDRSGPAYLGNVDDRLLIFLFPDGTRFGLAVLDEPSLTRLNASLAQGKAPLVRVLDEDLEEA
jgi:hypothetical protein